MPDEHDRQHYRYRGTAGRVRGDNAHRHLAERRGDHGEHRDAREPGQQLVPVAGQRHRTLAEHHGQHVTQRPGGEPRKRGIPQNGACGEQHVGQPRPENGGHQPTGDAEDHHDPAAAGQQMPEPGRVTRRDGTGHAGQQRRLQRGEDEQRGPGQDRRGQQRGDQRGVAGRQQPGADHRRVDENLGKQHGADKQRQPAAHRRRRQHGAGAQVRQQRAQGGKHGEQRRDGENEPERHR